QGMIEYIPGEYCWRPVDAKNYMFIHCIFIGFKKAYKNKGYGTLMVNECLKDAKKEDMLGVAVVTREGSFMVGKELFLKNGFEVVDSAPPDFELLVKKFDKSSPNPKFKGEWEKKLNRYKKGLTIIHSAQCPPLVKSVKEISETANNKYGIKPKIVELKSCKEAQESPCAIGTCGIIYNGKILAQHPISKTRFKNIMDKELK
ncbi:MAG: YoaP domain-containing protein, partial [Thermoplasmata archaeon]